MTPTWSDEKIALLKALAANKISSSQIAEQIQEKFGDHCTKDMVLGKMRRLELASSTQTPLWSEEAVELLKQAVESRMSINQIARYLSRRLNTNYSEKSIRTKMSRLGLKTYLAQQRAAGHVPDPAPQSVLSPPVQAHSKPEPEETVVRDITMMVLPAPRRCQYPFGQPGRADFRFCGDAVVPGKSYCEQHCKSCFLHWARREGFRNHAE